MQIAAHSLTLHAEVEQGDQVGAGVQVSLRCTDEDLEVDLLPRIYRVICSNGLLERVRTGDRRRYDDRHDAMLRSWVNAGVQRHLTDKEGLAAQITTLREAAKDRLPSGEAYLNAALKEFGAPISVPMQRGILDDYARARSGSRWTMLNAATSRARIARTLKEAMELERLGALMSGFTGPR